MDAKVFSQNLLNGLTLSPEYLLAVFWETSYAFLLLGSASLAIFIYVVYLICYKPLNRVKPYESVGFEHLENQGFTAKWRAFRVNQMKKMNMASELPPVYPNGWFALLESDDLPISSTKFIQALGENFAVFRDTGGEVHVLDAFCPHLGANLGIGGKVRGNCIQCPFHGWLFDGKSGQCTSIPYSASKPPAQAKVKTWPCTESLGLIMVWYHAEGEEPFWQPPDVQGINDGQFAFCGRSEHYISTHIQDLPENGSDVAHLNVLHTPGIPTGSHLNDLDGFLSKIFSHSWTASWTQSSPSYTSNVALTHIGKVFSRRLPFMDIMSNIEQSGPGLVILRFDSLFGLGKGILVQAVTPVEPLMQRMIHRFYFSNRWLKIIGKIFLYGENIQVRL
ncbi:unnamed protein product [Notodromas monacha]|uniref:cholesterol 7-desaturase n=1 Tax=Notodromas monacha TaxID=399045 RepID=A0A7R9BT40_9CRUS|nr:unnamed protein product [Notodromas monacha]CAG0920178.1 unnamed protein product [Notodromas monacha]